jgi:energy-coupling factor transport system substrate-specific component
VTWVAASFAVLALALGAGFAWYEHEHPTTRVLALVATLAALAALGRVAFAPLPNVKPTTDIVLIAGYVLGGAPGFVTGAVAALASNLFFGQGPWTPWQMVAWGLCGLLGAVLARVTRRRLGRVPLALVCAAAGFGFGAVMNVSQWVMYSGDHTTAKLAAVFATSFPFDVAHAAGNFTFCLVFGPALVAALARFRTRMEVDWRPAAAIGAASVLAAVALLAPPATPARAGATAQAARSSTAWLLGAQNDDGGWGAAPGQSSAGLYTGWAALGLAAAGTNPRDAGSPSVVSWLRAHSADVSDLGEVSRTVLVLRAAGLPPKLGGRDLVRELVGKQRSNGSFSGRVNTTSFALLALRAAGRSRSSRPVRRATAWLARQADADGGFNFASRGGPSGVDDTAAAVQALAAAGRKRAKLTQRATTWMAGRQNTDGGFPLQPGGPSNAQSTAFAVQALIAAGRNPARVHHRGSRDPLAYLRSLTAGSGAVRYSRTSNQTPVWVTGEALLALGRRPLPLKPVKRRAAKTAAPAPAPAPTATPAAIATPSPTPTAKPRPRPSKQRIAAHAAAPATPPTRRLLTLAYAAGHTAGALSALLSTGPQI